MKRFSTVRDTQTGSQSYVEKRRRRREIEMTGGEEGEPKGERAIYPVINSLFVLHSLEHSERLTEFHREEKREEGDRGDQEERRGSQKEREQCLQ